MSDEIINIQSLRSIDSLPISDTGPHMLDYERVRVHIARAIERRRYSGGPEPQHYLLDRRCLVPVGNDLLVTPAGMLCFGYNPQAIFAHAAVNLIHYRGSEANSLDVIHIERGIGGTIFDQLTRIEDYLYKNTHHGMTVRRGFERVDIDEYPAVVLRELSVNMLAHRDYQDVQSLAHIKLFTNHIEWMNPGGLPEGVTIEQLLNVQRSRNPTLFTILYDSGMIEGVGQGLDTVFAILQREHMQPPAFEDINHAFFVARVYGRPLDALTNRDIYGQLTDRQRRILTLIRQQGEIASSDIVAILKAQGTDAAYRSVMRDLSELIQQGLIRSSGRSRNTRYRLMDEPTLPLSPEP
jgi:predicted HTH transcriptional regulator